MYGYVFLVLAGLDVKGVSMYILSFANLDDFALVVVGAFSFCNRFQVITILVSNSIKG